MLTRLLMGIALAVTFVLVVGVEVVETHHKCGHQNYSEEHPAECGGGPPPPPPPPPPGQCLPQPAELDLVVSFHDANRAYSARWGMALVS